MGSFVEALPPPRTEPAELRFTIEDLAVVRKLVLDRAMQASLEADRARDLVLAVNELATNSLRHGGGAGAVRIWTEEETLVCEVGDSGHIADRSVGHVRPTPAQHTGRGLWVVNRLCDRVQIHSTPTGSVVRVQMRLARSLDR
jgi:anti-sigma regulatory factor (Ser/Thr protein kinase)